MRLEDSVLTLRDETDRYASSLVVLVLLALVLEARVDEAATFLLLEAVLLVTGESEEYLVFLLEDDLFDEFTERLALLLLVEGKLATFVLEDLSLVFLTDVFVDFLSLVLLVLSAFCASTVKAKNNIANMMLKFFMTFSFS